MSAFRGDPEDICSGRVLLSVTQQRHRPVWVLSRLGAVSCSSIGRKVLVLAIAQGVTLMRFWGRLNAAARVHDACGRRGGGLAAGDASARCCTRHTQYRSFGMRRRRSLTDTPSLMGYALSAGSKAAIC